MSEENELDFDDELRIITMYDDEGNENDFFVVDMLNMDGSNYILVVDTNADEEDPEGVEALILKETDVDVENDEATYDILDNEEEFTKVSLLFSENSEFELE